MITWWEATIQSQLISPHSSGITSSPSSPTAPLFHCKMPTHTSSIGSPAHSKHPLSTEASPKLQSNLPFVWENIANGAACRDKEKASRKMVSIFLRLLSTMKWWSVLTRWKISCSWRKVLIENWPTLASGPLGAILHRIQRNNNGGWWRISMRVVMQDTRITGWARVWLRRWQWHAVNTSSSVSLRVTYLSTASSGMFRNSLMNSHCDRLINYFGILH